MSHIPVLLNETISGLKIKKGDVVVDGTLGDGGHALPICNLVGNRGKVIGIDADAVAIKRAQEKLNSAQCSFIVIRGNFRNIDTILKKEKIRSVDKIVFDLGLRSGHLEESGRGFSFRREEPLLMTFDSSPKKETLTAYEIVNSWSKDDLTRILREYGEERYARRIAATIVVERKINTIGTTTDLLRILEKSIPKRFQGGRLHFATKTFQALRIATNDEIEALKETLEKSSLLIAPSGRIAVISFHSIEDRVVKRFFKEKEKNGGFIVITKKPIIPSKVEIQENSRSRSAKLRIIEKMR